MNGGDLGNTHRKTPTDAQIHFINVVKSAASLRERAQGVTQMEEYKANEAKLIDTYRATLIEAFEQGEAIKDLYSILPPKVIYDCEAGYTQWDQKKHSVRKTLSISTS